MADDIALLRIDGVIAKVGLSRATIYRKVKANQFPKPRKLDGVAVWFQPEIDAYILAFVTGEEWNPNMGQNMGRKLAA